MAIFKYNAQNIYYETYGEGFPVLFFHGNTTSSRLFTHEIPFYSQFFEVIVFDWLGHGKSDKLDFLPDDLWRMNAEQGIALCDYLNINEVNLIGTSGGALSALNFATIQPNRCPKIIADSFFGNRLSEQEAIYITNNRQRAKKNFLFQQYWKNFVGDYWETMVDIDCDFLLSMAKKQLPLIYGNLSDINSEVLLVASSDDEVIPDIFDRMDELANELRFATKAYYDYGKHTFMITEKEEFRKLVLNFFNIM